MAKPEGRLGADLEEALAHAERVLEAVDRAHLRLRGITVAQIGCGILALTVVLLLVLSGSIGWIVVLVPLLAALGVAASLHLVSRTVMRQQERDRAVMLQMSRMVRDLLPVVADDEGWSELRHVMTRARLSRFPISERSR